MPHQLRGMKGGGLGAEFAPTRPLLPVGREAAGVFPRDGSFHRRGVLPFADGLVVGEGNVAHIQHVLQQGDGVHGQVAERVLHRPAVGVLLQGWHQGELTGVCGIGGPHPDEQQPLPRGCGKAGAAGSTVVGLGVLERLRHALALAAAVETPAVIGAFK